MCKVIRETAHKTGIFRSDIDPLGLFLSLGLVFVQETCLGHIVKADIRPADLGDDVFGKFSPGEGVFHVLLSCSEPYFARIAVLQTDLFLVILIHCNFIGTARLISRVYTHKETAVFLRAGYT